MHILVTNDDGVTAPGLLALATPIEGDEGIGVEREINFDLQVVR